MQEHVELEVSLEIIMARIAQAIFNLNKGNGEENTKKLNDLIALQEEAYKGNRKAVEACGSPQKSDVAGCEQNHFVL